MKMMADSVTDILDTLQDSANGPIVSATATVSNANMKAIADSVWQRTFGQADAVAGSIWDSINTAAYVQGAAAGLDSASVQGAVIAALNADTTMNLKKINAGQVVIGGENDDSASLFVYSTGSKPPAQFDASGILGGPGILIDSDSGRGVSIITHNLSVDGKATSTYAALWAEAKGPNGNGAVFANSNEDSIAHALGAGLLIKSDGWNNGLTISVGEAGSDTTAFPGTVPDTRLSTSRGRRYSTGVMNGGVWEVPLMTPLPSTA